MLLVLASAVLRGKMSVNSAALSAALSATPASSERTAAIIWTRLWFWCRSDAQPRRAWRASRARVGGCVIIGCAAVLYQTLVQSTTRGAAVRLCACYKQQTSELGEAWKWEAPCTVHVVKQ